MWYASTRPKLQKCPPDPRLPFANMFSAPVGAPLLPGENIITSKKDDQGSKGKCLRYTMWAASEQVSSKLYKPTFILSFLSQFTCFAPFFFFVPLFPFFINSFFFSHFTNIAGASQCSNCDCNFCKSPGSGSLPKIHRYINCYKTAFTLWPCFWYLFWDFFVLFDTFFGGLLLNMHCYINCYKTALIPGFTLCRLYVPPASKISGNGNFMGPSALLSVSESESCLARRYILEIKIFARNWVLRNCTETPQ